MDFNTRFKGRMTVVKKQGIDELIASAANPIKDSPLHYSWNNESYLYSKYPRDSNNKANSTFLINQSQYPLKLNSSMIFEERNRKTNNMNSHLYSSITRPIHQLLNINNRANFREKASVSFENPSLPVPQERASSIQPNKKRQNFFSTILRNNGISEESVIYKDPKLKIYNNNNNCPSCLQYYDAKKESESKGYNPLPWNNESSWISYDHKENNRYNNNLLTQNEDSFGLSRTLQMRDYEPGQTDVVLIEDERQKIQTIDRIQSSPPSKFQRHRHVRSVESPIKPLLNPASDLKEYYYGSNARTYSRLSNTKTGFNNNSRANISKDGLNENEDNQLMLIKLTRAEQLLNSKNIAINKGKERKATLFSESMVSSNATRLHNSKWQDLSHVRRSTSREQRYWEYNRK